MSEAKESTKYFFSRTNGRASLLAIAPLSLRAHSSFTFFSLPYTINPMTSASNKMSDDAQQAHDYLLQLGKLTVDFAHVERVPLYGSDRPESDVEHSFHLAISAIEIAANYHPELDVGLVAQFSLVHDLPEVHVGDVPTFDISEEDRAKKEADEKAATEQLLRELPPHLAGLLERYEEQTEPEARFVRFIDKLLPAVIHATVSEPNKKMFKEKYNMHTLEQIEKGDPARVAYLKKMFPEFDFIHIVRGLVVQSSRERIYGHKSN